MLKIQLSLVKRRLKMQQSLRLIAHLINWRKIQVYYSLTFRKIYNKLVFFQQLSLQIKKIG